MKKIFLVSAFAFLPGSFLFSQALATIPVVFHVIYQTTAENLPDSCIMEQMQVLNTDFDTITNTHFQNVAANCQIKFALAVTDPLGNPTSGIVRVQTNVSSFTANDNMMHVSSGGDDAWDKSCYLNIWICKLGNGMLGYCDYNPIGNLQDGVVLDYRFTGITCAQAPYDFGKTGTYEVARWLNVRPMIGLPSCIDADSVSDTPLMQSDPFGCSLFPLLDGCSPNSPGVMFENYMTTSSDACKNIFTLGQKARMWACLNGPRNSIATQNGCNALSVKKESADQLFSVYPSPSIDGKINISFAREEKINGVEVFNAMGEIIWEMKNIPTDKNNLVIDLSNAATGIYTVKVSSENFVECKRVMKIN
jgi:hypothetical protein